MKHILPFVLFEAKAGSLSRLTKKQEEFLNRYTHRTWSVNPTTGSVDVQGDFKCSDKRLKSLRGISFGHVSGNFSCSGNELTSLEGSPQTVNGGFYCNSNRLTSLEGAPRTVGWDFYCFNNPLTSLEGAPETVDGDFWCDYNQLTSLEGAPQTVGGGFSCYHNQLTTLAGAPQTVGGNFKCYGNRLTSLEGAPETVDGYFTCDEFKLDQGKWNMEGWLEVLNTGTEEAKRLISTLPLLQPDWWNSELKQNPKKTILQMVPIWDDFPKEIQDEIQIPSNLKDGFENLLDLYRAGIF